jgi:hypothetical protein
MYSYHLSIKNDTTTKTEEVQAGIVLIEIPNEQIIKTGSRKDLLPSIALWQETRFYIES